MQIITKEFLSTEEHSLFFNLAQSLGLIQDNLPTKNNPLETALKTLKDNFLSINDEDDETSAFNDCGDKIKKIREKHVAKLLGAAISDATYDKNPEICKELINTIADQLPNLKPYAKDYVQFTKDGPQKSCEEGNCH